MYLVFVCLWPVFDLLFPLDSRQSFSHLLVRSRIQRNMRFVFLALFVQIGLFANGSEDNPFCLILREVVRSATLFPTWRERPLTLWWLRRKRRNQRRRRSPSYKTITAQHLRGGNFAGDVNYIPIFSEQSALTQCQPSLGPAALGTLSKVVVARLCAF